MKKTTPNRRHGILLAAAVAALSTLAWTRPAAAQYPAGQDGHANDANNRVGGWGINGSRKGSAVTPNDIVNRNVTGLNGFSGPLGERDPRAFTGPVPGLNLDAFNRQSYAPTDIAGQTYLNGAQTYYGDTRAVAPPANSLPLGFNGGYIGTTTNSPASISNGLNTLPPQFTVGLQGRTLDRDQLILNQTLNSPNYTTLVNNPTLTGTVTASPIYGLRTTTTGTDNFSTPALPDRLGMDDLSVIRMRQELRESAPTQPQSAQQQGLNPQQPNTLNQPLNQPLGQSFDSPADSAISNRLATPTQLNGAPLSSTGIIPANVNARPSLIPPEQQSSTIGTLKERMARFSDVDRAIAEARLTRPQPTQQTPPTLNNTATNVMVKPGQGPVQIKDLAEGIKAKGLHDLLAGGEELIKQGKYDLAVQRFNQAQRVAPNNPLPQLDRAHAELAAGFYARAEQDLRAVFRSDPYLVMAQFDLNSMVSKERIDFLRKDLQDLTRSDPKAERPWFLLAYLDYNTGNAAAAETNLNEAEQRSGRLDRTIPMLRQHWVLPSKSKTTTPAPAPAATPATPAPARVKPAPAPAPLPLNK